MGALACHTGRRQAVHALVSGGLINAAFEQLGLEFPALDASALAEFEQAGAELEKQK